MKSIILFRHGKSDWYADYDVDHNRPLAKRGIKAAKKMGVFLSELGQLPDIAVSSTAIRAKTTVGLAMDAGDWTCPLELDPTIYGGSPNVLLHLVQEQDDTLNIICLVGHEPNFSMFISMATHGRNIRFPTAAMAKIDFAVTSWKDVRFGEGKLAWLQQPKALE